ncbi:MAG: twin-arginine translocase TatA/TatE family subunit [Spirochaetaceae bacterium]|nr:twin-arginine translocase TatA/TatE family subunit [Spirochaetaceae bacterium]
MFGLGIWEIALLCIALLVFVRPEELPKVLGKLGQWYGRVTGSSRYIMRRLQEPFELDDEQAGGDGTAGSANSIADNGARPEPRNTVPGGQRRGETEPDGGDGK